MNNSVGNTARLLWAGLRALLVLTVVCGVLYPLAVTGVAQGVFPHQANGSEISANGKVVGSELIGQRYDLPLKKGQETAAPDLKWFQPRPSNGLGTNSVNTQYKLILSGATNRSGDSKELIDWVRTAKAAVVKDNSVPGHPVSPRTCRPMPSPLPAPAWTRPSPRRTHSSRCAGWPSGTTSPSTGWRSSSNSTRTAGSWASWGSRGSMSSSSTSRSSSW